MPKPNLKLIETPHQTVHEKEFYHRKKIKAANRDHNAELWKSMQWNPFRLWLFVCFGRTDV
jgi:hypothetical protein